MGGSFRRGVVGRSLDHRAGVEKQALLRHRRTGGSSGGVVMIRNWETETRCHWLVVDGEVQGHEACDRIERLTHDYPQKVRPRLERLGDALR